PTSTRWSRTCSRTPARRSNSTSSAMDGRCESRSRCRLSGTASGSSDASVCDIPEEMRTREHYGPVAALGQAAAKTWGMSALTARMLWNVVTGDVSVKNLSGPINIAEYAGSSARQGILAFLSFLAIVSVSLFVLNLLPIPILDGGQIVYQLAELAKG